MKSLFKLSIFLLTYFIIPIQGHSQSTTDTSMVVNGVCGMCKNTIETAVIDLTGIENANWNVESKILSLRFDSGKLSLAEINEAVNKAGYDSEFSTGDDKAYQKLNPCCHYRDPQVIKDHQ